MINKLRLKLAFFYGFIHAFFGIPVVIADIPKREDLEAEFYKGYFAD